MRGRPPLTMPLGAGDSGGQGVQVLYYLLRSHRLLTSKRDDHITGKITMKITVLHV